MVRGRSVYRAVWIVVWLMNWAIGCMPIRCVPDQVVTPEMMPAATATEVALLSCPTATRFRPTETATSAFPKYSPEEGYFILSELVRTNGGCQFPCWLGITPGESSWTEVQSFFARFDSAIVSSSSHAAIHVPKEFGFYDSVDIQAEFWLEGDRIVSIKVASGVWYWFTKALRELGQPEEIRIRTFSQYAGPYIPFIIVLFYPSKGIAAEYGDDVLKESPTTLRACLDEDNSFYFWKPDRKLTFEEFQERFDLEVIEEEPYLPVDKALGMDVATFYQRYKDALNPICLETPRDLWPNPFGP